MRPRWRTARLAPALLVALAVQPAAWGADAGLDARVDQEAAVGIVRGGERFNIIPGEVHLEGTVRTYKQEVRDLVERRMREILDGVTRGNGRSFDMEYQPSAVPAGIRIMSRLLIDTLSSYGNHSPR